MRQIRPVSQDLSPAFLALSALYLPGTAPETLRALGELYANDGRFRRYIDNAGGEGTAAFANQAIAAYCAI